MPWTRVGALRSALQSDNNVLATYVVPEARGISANRDGFPVTLIGPLPTDGEHINPFHFSFSFHSIFLCNSQQRKLEILSNHASKSLYTDTRRSVMNIRLVVDNQYLDDYEIMTLAGVTKRGYMKCSHHFLFMVISYWHCLCSCVFIKCFQGDLMTVRLQPANLHECEHW